MRGRPPAGGCASAILRLALATLVVGAVATAAAEPSRAPVANAVPALRLENVVREAANRRREVVAATARARAAAAVPDRVEVLPDPMVMASIDHLPTMLHGVDYSFMVEQQFPLSGVLGARARAARAEAAALRTDVRRVGLEVETEAAIAFAMVAEAQAMRDVVVEQEGLSRAIVEVTKARLAGAEASAAEVMRAEIDAQRLVTDREVLEVEVEGAGAMLNAALARPPAPSAPRCDLSSPDEAPLPMARLHELALASRPELETMRSRVVAARADVDVMDAMYAPMAVARIGGASTMTDGPGLMTAFGISVPLWRGSLDAGVTEAEEMVRMAGADVDAMGTMIRGEVAAARARVVGLQARKTAIETKLLPLARTTVDLSLTGYAGGQLPLVSVVDAARALRELRMELVTVRSQLLVAWVRLGRTVGTLDLSRLTTRRVP